MHEAELQVSTVAMQFPSSEVSPLPISSISHLSRVVKEVEKTSAFYANVLGFVPVRRPSSFEFEGSWLLGYGLSLHLIKGTPVREARPINPSDDHTSFQSRSVPEVKMALQQHGIPFVETHVEEMGVKITQVFVHDPDHNMIEICDCDCLPIEPIYAQDAKFVQESCAQQNVMALIGQSSIESSSSHCAGMSPLRHALRSGAA